MPPKRRRRLFSSAAAARQKRRRYEEDEITRQRRLEVNRDRMTRARAEEGEEARRRRLDSDRHRTATRRARQNDLQRQEQLQINRDRTAAAGAQEDDLARRERLDVDRQRHSVARVQEHPNIPPALNYNPAQPTLPCCIGSMTNVCVNCGAMTWKRESSGMCCSSGKVRLPPLQEPPPLLKTLLLRESEDSKHFLANIRKYNSAFQMKSMGCKDKCTISLEVYVFYQIKNPSLLIYFLGDAEVELRARQGIVPGLRQRIIQDLQTILHSMNPYVQSFKVAKDILTHHDLQHRVVIHADRRPANEHRGRFNAPACDEVAVLMVTEEHGRRV